MLGTETAILIGAGLGTLGWLYTARRARTLAKKQHTVSIMLQASMNKRHQSAQEAIAPHLNDRNLPNLQDAENEPLKMDFRLVLNHYEFIAAGLRNGDFDEQLMYDSERGSIVTLVEVCNAYIFSLRDTRQRQSIYENLEWLHGRWGKHPPRWYCRFVEWVRGRPLKGKKAEIR
jgi:hypothetical protein